MGWWNRRKTHGRDQESHGEREQHAILSPPAVDHSPADLSASMVVVEGTEMDTTAAAAATATATAFPPEGEIPVDYKIRCHLVGLTGDDLTAYDAGGAVAFQVRSSSVGTPPRRARILSDAAGVPLFSISHHGDEWEGFKGGSWECKDSLFKVKIFLYAPFKTELEAILSGENPGDPRSSFRLKGSPFLRSCTIYRGDSVVAQANLLYKLKQFIYSRRKFRLTVFPGNDHALILAMLVVFLGIG